MIDTESPSFKLGEKLGHLFMTYIGVRLIIKGAKLVVASSRAILNSASSLPPIP